MNHYAIERNKQGVFRLDQSNSVPNNSVSDVAGTVPLAGLKSYINLENNGQLHLGSFAVGMVTPFVLYSSSHFFNAVFAALTKLVLCGLLISGLLLLRGKAPTEIIPEAKEEGLPLLNPVGESLPPLSPSKDRRFRKIPSPRAKPRSTHSESTLVDDNCSVLGTRRNYNAFMQNAETATLQRNK